MEGKSTKKDLILKVLFIVGVIILIFIFAFAIIKIVPTIFSSFANVSQSIVSPFTSKKIEVTANDTELNSGDKFNLSWNYSPKESGYYGVKYDCTDSITIQILSKDGPKTLLCNKSYNVAESESAEFGIVLKKVNTFTDVPFVIEYISNENKSVLASGKITISVKNETASADDDVIVTETINTNTGTQNTNTGSTNSNVVNNPVTNFPADLAISNAYAPGDASVTFTISNIGGRSTGVWSFNYSAPGENTVSAPMQISLAPGQGIRFTLNFNNNVDSGNVMIYIDPNNYVADGNRINNSTAIRINGDGNNSSDDDDDYNSNDDADLDVTDFEVGRLSGSRFVEDDEIDEDDEMAVQFTVKNIGGENTGEWRYMLTNLPFDNNDDDEYESRDQSSLRPGQSREIIVSFDNPDNGNYTVKIEVDSDNDVDEERENNNTDTARIEVQD